MDELMNREMAQARKIYEDDERDSSTGKIIALPDENLSDDENATRWAQLHNKHARYCDAHKTWYVWSGLRWIPVSGAVLTEWAERLRDGKK